MNLKSLLMVSVVCVMTASAMAAPSKVYKWTDSKGQTHYSQHPPYNTDTEVVKPQTGHSDPVDYSAANAKPEKEKSEANSAVAATAIDNERCENARKNVETLKTYARIRVKGDDGQFRYITPDEHAQKLAEANKAIEESCE